MVRVKLFVHDSQTRRYISQLNDVYNLPHPEDLIWQNIHASKHYSMH